MVFINKDMRRTCFGLLRTFLIVVNLLVAAIAVTLVGVSLNVFYESFDIDTLAGDTNQNKLIHARVSISFAVLGLLVCLTAIIGFVGAVKRCKFTLCIYSAIMTLMVVLVFILIGFTHWCQDGARARTLLQTNSTSYVEVDKSYINSILVLYNHVDSNDVKTKLIDNVQKSLSCCGINSPNDWTEYSLQKIPKSCCSEPVESSLPVFRYCTESDYKVGCWKASIDNFFANMESFRNILFVYLAFLLIRLAATYILMLALVYSHDVV